MAVTFDPLQGEMILGARVYFAEAGSVGSYGNSVSQTAEPAAPSSYKQLASPWKALGKIRTAKPLTEYKTVDVEGIEDSGAYRTTELRIATKRKIHFSTNDITSEAFELAFGLTGKLGSNSAVFESSSGSKAGWLCFEFTDAYRNMTGLIKVVLWGNLNLLNPLEAKSDPALAEYNFDVVGNETSYTSGSGSGGSGGSGGYPPVTYSQADCTQYSCYYPSCCYPSCCATASCCHWWWNPYWQGSCMLDWPSSRFMQWPTCYWPWNNDPWCGYMICWPSCSEQTISEISCSARHQTWWWNEYWQSCMAQWNSCQIICRGWPTAYWPWRHDPYYGCEVLISTSYSGRINANRWPLENWHSCYDCHPSFMQSCDFFYYMSSVYYPWHRNPWTGCLIEGN